MGGVADAFWQSLLVSRDGKWLAVTCSQPDVEREDVCRMTADGDQLQNLTKEAQGIFSALPSWSPHGDKIAFERDAEIFVMDRNGRNRVRLTGQEEGVMGDLRPAWSPDGTKIAFYSNRDAQEPSPRDRARYLRDERRWFQCCSTDPSPIGRSCAGMVSRMGSGLLSCPFEMARSKIRNWNIYVMDANGENEMRVTDHLGLDSSPTWVIPDRSLPVDTRDNRATLWGQLKSERQ